jgi:hypothetical protein
MAIVTPFPTVRKSHPIRHYALYGDRSGVAEVLNGSGYLFRAEGERRATVISSNDPQLTLLGRFHQSCRSAGDARAGSGRVFCEA